MNTKSFNQRTDNTETSASTETKSKVSMKKGTFTLPTLQESQSQYDNIGAYNQLQVMMKG